MFISFLFLFPLSKTQNAKALTVTDVPGQQLYRVEEDTEDDLLIYGDSDITIDGDVNGDLYIFGSVVTVNGEVEGNVYLIGGTVNLTSIIGKSLFALGGDISLDGQVIRDSHIFGKVVRLQGEIGEDLNIVAQQATIGSLVGDDLRTAGGTMKINNNVGGDLMSVSGRMNVDGDIAGSIHSAGTTSLGAVQIAGDVVMYGDKGSLAYSEGTEIQGEEIFKRPQGSEYVADYYYSPIPSLFEISFGFKSFLSLMSVVGYVMVGYLLFKFAPVRLDATLSRMSDLEQAGKSFLVGLLSFPVGGSIAFLLAVSVFGWPLLKVLILLALLVSSMATPIAGIWIGRKVLPLVGSKRKYIVALTSGVVIISIIQLIPLFGWLFNKVVLVIVVGALLRMQWDKYKVAQNLHVKMVK